MKELEILHLSGNFTEVSPLVFQLPKLKVLTLEGKYFSLPKVPRKLVNLSYLRLSGHFPAIPVIIDDCPNLRYLRIMSKDPMALSPNIIKLKKLEELRIESTIITEISPVIENMERLKAIYFIDSWIKSIPEALFRIKLLEDLRLDLEWGDIFVDPEITYFPKPYWPIPELELPRNIPYNPSITYIDLSYRPVSENSFNRLLKVYGKEIVRGK